MRAILAGGGTGGHVIPALAIAQELTARFGERPVFVGTDRGIETRLVPAAGFELHLIAVGQLKSVSLATRLATLAGLPRAVFQSLRILRQVRPQVVIGMGGYASGPVMLAAALAGVPTVAFESNFVPGFANRRMAPFVQAAAVQFEETARYFRRAEVTGVPVRPEFFDLPPRPPDAPPSLLVFGGSQGARALNRVVLDCLPALSQALPGLRIVHQTGERDYNDAQAAYAASAVSAVVTPFIEGMAQAFGGADLLLCRSGASTVAEIAAAGKAAILVPFPRATDDHQRRNAEALVRQGAAEMILEADLTPERLLRTVAGLLGDRARLHAMGAAARRLAHRDAARAIVELAARAAGVQ